MTSMQQQQQQHWVVRRCSSLRVRTLSDGEEQFNEFRVAADAPVQLGSFGRVLPASVATGKQLHVRRPQGLPLELRTSCSVGAEVLLTFPPFAQADARIR